MKSNGEENELFAASPGDDSDGALSPVTEPEPNPGVDGVPVRCAFVSAFSVFVRMFMDNFVLNRRVRREYLPHSVSETFVTMRNVSGRQNGTVYSNNTLPRET